MGIDLPFSKDSHLIMFARQVFKAAQPLRTQTRRYATEPASGGSSTAIYGGVAAVLAGAGYYFYNQGDNAAKVKGAAKDAEAKAKDAVGAAKSKVEGATAKVCLTGGDQGFISLKLDSVENINHNTKKFRFELPEGDQVSGLHVASALLTKYKGPEMEKPAIRPYTPVNDEGDKGYLDLLVKKYPWSANKHTHVALIAGGTGITPMYQVARAIFNNPEDKTKVTMVFANITEEDILLKKELNEL